MTVKITKPAINLREILSGIEANATADQTGAEIKTAYESNSDTNAFTDSDKTKLDGIEANATADQTGAEIKAAYEGEADTNAFTDTLLNKLNGIETGADVTDATNVAAAGAVMDADYADGKYLVGTATPGTYTQVTDNSTDWNTAYSWGDHSTAGYITNGLHLGELHDVQISGTPADNEFLAYDTTTGAFINQTAAEAGLQSVLAEGAFVDGDKTKLDGINDSLNFGALVNPDASQSVAGNNTLHYLTSGSATPTVVYDDFSPVMFNTSTGVFTIPSGVSRVDIGHFYQIGGSAFTNKFAVGWEWKGSGGTAATVYLQGLTDYENFRNLLTVSGFEVSANDTFKPYILQNSGTARTVFSASGSFFGIRVVK